MVNVLLMFKRPPNCGRENQHRRRCVREMTCVRFVLHFPFLGLLPPPIDGWSDITEMYVARFGIPKPGTAVWIRTCQHIDGFIDLPKVLRFRIPG